MRQSVAIFSSHGVLDSHLMGSSILTLWGRGQSKSLFLQPLHSHVMRKPTVGESDDVQVFTRFADRLVPRLLLQDHGNRYVLRCGQPREQVEVLEDEADLVQSQLGQLVWRERPYIRALD